MSGSTDAIRALIEPALSSDHLDRFEGLEGRDGAAIELWDVEVSSHTVRVLVDRPGGIDLDTLAELDRAVVSPLLDAHPELTPEGHFDLELSSPGVERTLRRLEHFERYVGSEVSVKTSLPVDGARRLQGRLEAVDADGIDLVLSEGPPGRRLRIAHSEIERARTVLLWGPAPKKPAPKKPAAPKRPAAGNSKSQSQAVKRPAATGADGAGTPVASNDRKDNR